LFYVILRVDGNDIPKFQILNSTWRATVLGVGSFVFVIMVAMFGKRFYVSFYRLME